MSNLSKLRALSKHGKISLSHVDKIMNTPEHEDLIPGIVSHPDLDKSRLEKLVAHPNISRFYGKHLFSHKNADPSLFDNHFNSTSGLRRIDTIDHFYENLESHHLDKINDALDTTSLNSKDLYKRDLASHPKISVDLQHKLFGEGDDVVKSRIVENPHLDKSLFDKAIKDPNAYIREKAIQFSSPNKSVTHHDLEKVMNDPDYEVRKEVAYHSKATKHQLDRLMDDSDPDVVAAVLRNSNHDMSHVEKGLKHPSGYVQVSAQSSHLLQNR